VKTLRTQSLDLFPVHVEVIDFEDDPELNAALLEAARTDPALGSSTSGKSALAGDAPWVSKLRARYAHGIGAWLGETMSGARYDLEAYVFFNYTNGSSFTPVHDHLIEADLVAIYYAHAPAQEERPDGSYYAMDPGVLVLHDPRLDARLDRRGVRTKDHYKIYPRTNRLVVQPASIRHSVTPSPGYERLAVTCTVTVNRKDLFEGYLPLDLGGSEHP
jgi:hypothetical protein